MWYSKKQLLRRVRRHRFSLIEMMVSIVLISMLLTALFGAYSQVTYANSSIDKIRDQAFAARYLQSRLSDVLMKVSSAKKKGAQFFTVVENHSYADGSSLVFTFDNGYSCDPRFAATVLGRLYLSPGGELTLALWPIDSNEPMRKEVLYSDVTGLAFRFMTNEGEVVDQWDRDGEESGHPVLTWVNVETAEKKVDLAFPHPNSMEAIPFEVL